MSPLHPDSAPEGIVCGRHCQDSGQLTGFHQRIAVAGGDQDVCRRGKQARNRELQGSALGHGGSIGDGIRIWGHDRIREEVINIGQKERVVDINEDVNSPIRFADGCKRNFKFDHVSCCAEGVGDRATNPILSIGSRIQMGQTVGSKVDVVLGTSSIKPLAIENLLTGGRNPAFITVGIEP